MRATAENRASSFPPLCGIQRSLNAQPSSQVAILRGLGDCHQQVFCEDRPYGRLAKYANLYKFALLASQLAASHNCRKLYALTFCLHLLTMLANDMQRH